MIKKIFNFLTPGRSISKKIYYRYKISNFFYRKKLTGIAELCMYSLYKKYHCCISYKATIENKILFPHPIGIVIGEGVKIGNNCIIYQNVTLWRKNREISEYPQIGNNVIIYCNSTVIGDVSVGDNSIIGCNTVVLKSVTEGSKCVGVVK